MRKFFILGAAVIFSMSMLWTSYERESNNGSEGGTYNKQLYPSTANVIRKAVTDIDGNIYDAVQIGNQVWMAENLRTTRYADGTLVPMDSTYSETEPYRYAPGSDQTNEENMGNVIRYGYLYNWTAVMHGANSSAANPSGVQGVCPDGWHVPSDAEWTELTDYMSTQPTYMASGNPDHLAKALAATWGWNPCDSTDVPGNDRSTNNATGFSALPAGGFYGYHGYFGEGTALWSATEYDDHNAYKRYFDYDDTNVGGEGHGYNKGRGFSVRCVRN